MMRYTSYASMSLNTSRILFSASVTSWENNPISILWAHISLYRTSLVLLHSGANKALLWSSENPLRHYYKVLILTQGIYISSILYKKGLFSITMHMALSLVALGFGAILCYLLFIILGIYLISCISHRRLYKSQEMTLPL